MIALAVALQFVFGWIPCVAHAWTEADYPSIKPDPSGVISRPSRPDVDEWSWKFLNYWYANTEDGVSGQQAYIWNSTGQLVPYTSLFSPSAPKWWVAYCWNLRNNANNLKRPLRDDGLNTPWKPNG